MVELSPDGITVVDLSVKILMSNSRMSEMRGYATAAELLQHDYIEMPAPEERQSATDSVSSIIEFGGINNMEFEFMALDGSRFAAEAGIKLIPNVEGQPQEMPANIRDISERRLVEREIQKMTEDLSLINALNSAANRGDGAEEIVSSAAIDLKAAFKCVSATVIWPVNGSLLMQTVVASSKINLVERLTGIIGRRLAEKSALKKNVA